MHMRSAGASDAEALAVLIRVMGYDVDPEIVAKRLAELPADHSLLVAEAEGEVVGWVHTYVDHTLYGPAIAQLGGLSVKESWHGHGIGAQLLEAAEQWAREAGCHALWVRSGVQRADAHAFYRSRGYNDLKHQVVLTKQFRHEADDPRLDLNRQTR